MWIYKQKTGELSYEGRLECIGYSGAGPGKNNPDMQSVRNVGPIPVGLYRVGPPFDHPLRGPYALRLTPVQGTDTLGRSGFLMHGDSKLKPGTASKGCIIAPRKSREAVALSGDDLLKVVVE